MKKYIVIIIIILTFFISCKPSVITDDKIEEKYSYSSDQEAINGIFNNIYEFTPELNNYSLPKEEAELFKMTFFEEEEIIGKWLKRKYKSEIRRGEVIKISYKYKNELEGFDFIYMPYNNNIFSLNFITNYDFILGLEEKNNVPENDTKDTKNVKNSKNEKVNNTENKVNTTSQTNNDSKKNTQSVTTNTNNFLVNTFWEDESGMRTLEFGITSYHQILGDMGFSGDYRISGDTIIFYGLNNIEVGKAAYIGGAISYGGSRYRRIK